MYWLIGTVISLLLLYRNRTSVVSHVLDLYIDLKHIVRPSKGIEAKKAFEIENILYYKDGGEIHFNNGTNYYIYPFKQDPKWPLYKSTDMIGLRSNIIRSISVQADGTEEPNDDKFNALLNKYAGPVGDFYQNISIEISSDLLRDENANKLLNEDVKEIKFMTDLGEEFIIEKNKPILFSSLFL